MTQYRVIWEIDVEANNPVEAARMARQKQQFPRPGYWVGVFSVRKVRGTGVLAGPVRIDLDELDGYPDGWPERGIAFDDAVAFFWKGYPNVSA